MSSRILAASASLLFLITAGCGDGRPAIAQASGIVTLEGTPVAGATVTFVPVAGGRPSAALTDAEGRYTMNSFPDAEGALVGEHQVGVIKVSGKGAYELSGEDSAPDPNAEDDGSDQLSELVIDPDGETKEKSKITYDVPKRYMNAKSSELKIEVPSGGSDSLDLKLFN